MTRTNDAIRCVPRSRFGHKLLIDLFTDTPIDFKLLRYFQRQLQLSVKRRQARCRGGLLGCFTHWLIYLALYRRQHKHHSIVDAITTRHSLYPLLHPFLTSSLCACVLCRTHAQWRSCGVQWRHALILHYTWHTHPWHWCKMTTGLVGGSSKMFCSSLNRREISDAQQAFSWNIFFLWQHRQQNLKLILQ